MFVSVSKGLSCHYSLQIIALHSNTFCFDSWHTLYWLYTHGPWVCNHITPNTPKFSTTFQPLAEQNQEVTVFTQQW